jgi:hypothetical protein
MPGSLGSEHQEMVATIVTLKSLAIAGDHRGLASPLGSLLDRLAAYERAESWSLQEFFSRGDERDG